MIAHNRGFSRETSYLDFQLDSSYIIARMCHEIIFAPEAVEDLKHLRANVKAEVKDAIKKHLRHQPTKVSRSRIKRLKGLAQPQFRLRVSDVRVFYDVNEGRVEVLAIVAKPDAADWLANIGRES